MDIQEAISEFKMENALLGVRNPMKVSRNDLAISALQEQAEREKGCKYCRGEHNISTVSVTRHTSDREILTKIETLYCPSCGALMDGKDGSHAV